MSSRSGGGRTHATRSTAPWHARLAALRRQYPGRLYIRFGRIPPEGRSRNHNTRALEAGVSAFPTRYNRATDALEVDDRNGRIATFSAHEGRFAYLVTGGEHGTVGSDGEPLLADIRLLSRLEYQSNARGFVPVGP